MIFKLIIAANFFSKNVIDDNSNTSMEMGENNNIIPNVGKNNNYNAGNGIKLSNSLLTGNFFSLDGINPTPRGSAVIANEIIKSINENYKNFLKTVIPTLDVSKFEALKIK